MPDKQVFAKSLTDLTKSLEEKIHKICIFKVDDLYQKKIAYVMANLRSLNCDFKEFCELMFVKQSLNAGKLVTMAPQFKEWSQNIQKKLNDRKRAIQ